MNGLMRTILVGGWLVLALALNILIINPHQRLLGVGLWFVVFALFEGVYRLLTEEVVRSPAAGVQVLLAHFSGACLISSVLGLSQIGFDNTGAGAFYGALSMIGLVALIPACLLPRGR